MTLEQYFHTIINSKQPEKETKMNFLKLSMFFTGLLENLKELWYKPTAFVEEDPKLYDDGYWAFEMYTPEYTCDGELEPKQHDVIIEPSDTTWMETLDQILDIMGKHYGYNIKEQVYYSVQFPMNDPELAGYGRSLNDNVLQQLLLAHPEVYESQMFGQPEKDVFA
jgi:hypothetical protein